MVVVVVVVVTAIQLPVEELPDGDLRKRRGFHWHAGFNLERERKYISTMAHEKRG